MYQVDTAEKEGPYEPGTSSARFVFRDFILLFMSHFLKEKSGREEACGNEV